MHTCQCGAPIFIKKTRECRRCYDTRYHREMRASQPKRQHEPTTSECTYSAAHNRVRNRRGKASEHRCIECGNQAEEWSYRGGAPSEQRGTRTRHRHARTNTVRTAWCGDPNYYDPMCQACHAARDGHDYRTGYRHDGAKHSAFLAAEAAKAHERRRRSQLRLPAW